MTTTAGSIGTEAQRELTFRAILLGGLLTFVFTAANVYFGLRVGLTFSTAIPAAVISMALLRALGGTNLVENNIVQTIGSAAGAVGSMIFILPAFVIAGWWTEFPYWTTTLICVVGGTLGVMLSVPLRRALVIDSDLPYPEGVAGAEILKVGLGGSEGASENRVGLATIVLGGVAGGALGVLAMLKLAAAEVSKAFKLGAGSTVLGAQLSLGLVGVGHLIGLATGLAMLLGLVLARFALLPWLSAGVPGDVAEVAGQVFGQQVRMVGAGAIAVAALWSLLRISGSIARGLAGLLATARARRGGEVVALTERDLPGGIVLGISAALFLPIAAMVWTFIANGPLAGEAPLALTIALGVVLVLGVFTAVITGYMAGLVGTSNSPVSGVGILTILCTSLLVAGVFGGEVAPEAREALIAFTLFIAAFVFGSAIVANDNLQDLKTGQLVGSTPWKQQFALVIGSVAGSLVIAPVLNLLNGTLGFAGAPGAGANALPAPQASLFAAIAQGVLGGSLRWDLVGFGVGLGVVVILADEVLGRAGRMRLPPLAVAMGIYLPAQTILPTVIGAVIGDRWDRMAERTDRPAFFKRTGVLLATGLVVGDSLFGLLNSALVGLVGDPDGLAVVGDGFAPWGEAIGLAAAVGLTVFAYRRTRARAAAA